MSHRDIKELAQVDEAAERQCRGGKLTHSRARAWSPALGAQKGERGSRAGPRGGTAFSLGGVPGRGAAGLSLEGCPGMKQEAKRERMDFRAQRAAPAKI